MRLLVWFKATAEPVPTNFRLFTSIAADCVTVPTPGTLTFKVSTVTAAFSATPPVPPAFRFRFEPLPLKLTALPMMMLLSAFKVRLAEPVLVLRVMGALTVMLPASVPMPVVLTTTLVPALSKLLMAVLAIVELLPLAVQVPLLSLLFTLAEVISTFQGSNNQVPAWPAVALASPCTPVVLSWCPEVSMRPPSPPKAPPRASNWPCTCVLPFGLRVLDQTTTVPPLPLFSAEAFNTAPGFTITSLACRMRAF